MVGGGRDWVVLSPDGTEISEINAVLCDGASLVRTTPELTCGEPADVLNGEVGALSYTVTVTTSCSVTVTILTMVTGEPDPSSCPGAVFPPPMVLLIVSVFQPK